MELKFLYPYKDIEKYYISSSEGDNAWEEIMISPYWSQISEWAMNSCDFMKPKEIKDELCIKKQVDVFKELDLTVYEDELRNIIRALPKDDEDPMTIAFYPSDNNLEEGVFGSCVWGNIIICLNPLVKNSQKWIPYVFAHEYHHTVLGFYWYCLKEGKETKGNFLEYLINERQADEFAKNLYPYYEPSWHKGVTLENEQNTWEKLKDVLYEISSPQELDKYMFGNSELGIPPGAGYYFGSKIVKSFMEKYPNTSFSKLIQIPHQTIFDESLFSNK